MLVGGLWSAKKYFCSWSYVKCGYTEVNRVSRNSIFTPKMLFLGFWAHYNHLNTSKVYYSDSAHRELSFGTLTESLGHCVQIL